MGNTVDNGFFPGNFDNTSEARQDINPLTLKKMDDYYDKPGASTKHEALEAYEGGVSSKESGVSAGTAKVDKNSYQAAHQKASPQSGPVYQKLYNSKGNETQNVGKAVQIKWIVQEAKRPEVIIQTFQ